VRLVLVEWIDAQSDAETWLHLDELNSEPRMIRSVGYLLESPIEGHMSVAASWDEFSRHVGSVMHIPDAMVRRVTDLKPRRRCGK
jgi:hypothetical protein